ncbi:TPA: hypothetical protein ACSP71_001662 [Aeromonas hydrophila]
MKLDEIVKKVLGYIFPEFTNKITLMVVFSGVTLLSSSLIEQILKKIINEEFSWNLSDGNDAVIGVVVIALGLLHNYGFIREKNRSPHDPISIEKQRRDIEHDIKIFNKLNASIPEIDFKGYVEGVLSSHSYISKPEDLRDFFFYEGDKCDNDFVNEDLNSSKNALHDALLKFEDFKSKHFFVHGPNRANGNLYLCMRPEWNIDRGGNPSSEEERRYCELSSQLSSLGRELLKAYDEYRTAVKKVLSI